MNEDALESQLNEERAARTEKAEKQKEAAGGIKGAVLKALNNPLLQWLVPILLEALTAGIAPGWTVFVLWNYIVEKSKGKTPNLAEYLIVGILAVVVDVSQIILVLTGFLLIFSYAIIGPCLVFLYFWKIHKVGLKAPGPVKK